jgi:hypothetical protein
MEDTSSKLCFTTVLCFEFILGQKFEQLLEFNTLTGPPQEALEWNWLNKRWNKMIKK